MINVDVTCENDNDIITTENNTKTEVRKQTEQKHTMKARDLKTFLFYLMKFVIFVNISFRVSDTSRQH